MYLETSTLADQNIFFWNNYIFKCDATSIGTALAHIEFFATRGDPGGVSVYNESCEKKKMLTIFQDLFCLLVPYFNYVST